MRHKETEWQRGEWLGKGGRWKDVEMRQTDEVRGRFYRGCSVEKCSFPVCVEITGERADGSDEINNLKSVYKCLIVNKSTEHVTPAGLKFKHSSNVLQTIKKRGGQKISRYK